MPSAATWRLLTSTARVGWQALHRLHAHTMLRPDTHTMHSTVDATGTLLLHSGSMSGPPTASVKTEPMVWKKVENACHEHSGAQ